MNTNDDTMIKYYYILLSVVVVVLSWTVYAATVREATTTIRTVPRMALMFRPNLAAAKRSV